MVYTIIFFLASIVGFGLLTYWCMKKEDDVNRVK